MHSQLENNRKYQEKRRRKLGILTRKEIRTRNAMAFTEQAKIVHGQYDYHAVVYHRADHKVEIICKVHGKFKQSPTAHIQQKQGCPTCAKNIRAKICGYPRKTTEQFIKEAKQKHGKKYDYSQTKYTNIVSKLKIICVEHGAFEQEAKAHLRGQGCPVCANIARSIIFESRGEKYIKEELIKRGVYFEKQKTFSECKRKLLLRYDFYLPDYNVLIEFDGEQHYTFVPKFHGTLAGLKQVQQRDQIKDKFAKDNNIKLCRIRFDQYEEIPNKLNELL